MKQSVILSCLILLISISYGQKHSLELRLINNNTYYNVFNARADIQQKINGQDIAYEMTSKGKMSFKVINQTDSLYNLEGKYESISFELKGGQMHTLADSEDTSSGDHASALLARLKGQTFTVLMFKTGAIKEIKGIETAFANIYKDINISAEKKEKVLTQLNKNFGDEAVKNNIELATNIFPGHLVQEQSKWNKIIPVTPLMHGNINTTFQLIGVSASEFYIKGQAELNTSDPDKYITMNGMDYNYQMKGTILSDIRVDKESGWIKESKMEQSFSGKVNIKDNSQLPGGLVIPMEIKTVSIMTDK